MQTSSWVSRPAAAALLALALLTAACGTGTSATRGTTERTQGDQKTANVAGERTQANTSGPQSGAVGYHPQIKPSNFVDRVDNPLFPLKPGTSYKFRVETDEGMQTENMTVTHDKKNIVGVSATVVKDIVTVGGKPEEKTSDWYAQDRDGNVWYFGEETAEYKNGKVSNTTGSWEAGVDGAEPGIILNATPQVTDSYRQEYYKGEAEDAFWVTGVNEKISVPYGSYGDATRTLEYTPLEPKIVTEKYYAPGVGLVAEKNLSGPTETVKLVDVTHGG